MPSSPQGALRPRAAGDRQITSPGGQSRPAPTRAHVRLGEVQAEPSSDSVPVTEIEAALRKAAAKMGADAAVVVYDRTQTTGAYVTGPWWGRSVQTVQGRVIIVVAIKYK